LEGVQAKKINAIAW